MSLTKSVRILCFSDITLFLIMCKREREGGIKYMICIRVHTLWMDPCIIAFSCNNDVAKVNTSK